MNDQYGYISKSDRSFDRIGVRFSRMDADEIITKCFEDIQSPTLYVTCNLNHLRVLQSNPFFREAYRKAKFITLDSRPLQIASRILFNDALPLVTGADLFSVIFRKLRPGEDRPFFVSSSNETGEKLRQQLFDRGFLPDAVSFHTPSLGFERDALKSMIILDQLREHNATHLFMGVGAPKSECWVAQHLELLPPAHIFCVGAALDFTAGSKNRAPAWLGRIGFEWLHRLLSEPKRLLPRYAGDFAVLAKVLSGKTLVQVSPSQAHGTSK